MTPNNKVCIELLPRGKALHADRGASLQDILFAEGVEFPCGGKGRCRGCKVRVLDRVPDPTPEEVKRFSTSELADGWRLACRLQADRHFKLELAQWEFAILADDSPFEFTPREGLGIAIDLGTTTLVAQLVDLQTARVLAVRTAWNPQGAQGADVMSRIEFAVNDNEQLLTKLIRIKIGDLIREVIKAGSAEKNAVTRVVIVGNSVMHHLFCGIDVQPLAHDPFEFTDGGLKTFSATELGWRGYDNMRVSFLPCLGSFVGSDILAGIVATQMHKSDRLTALVDLGTNGEVVVGNKDRLFCTSTAAGPAFEGARIAMGMRAASGAISQVNLVDGVLQTHVLGRVEPKGICGSGLVDAVAAGLDLARIESSGRMPCKQFQIAPAVSLTQSDVRELQLAKAAVAAGIRLLVEQAGASLDDLTAVYLAGAFGNYINRTSAQRIGLLQFPSEKIRPIGNSALLGAKLALFVDTDSDFAFANICAHVQHINLTANARFQDTYAEEIAFPAR